MAPILFAHRGGWNEHPDNSLASFQAAADAGARAFETDARLDRNGVPILQHDPWLYRRLRLGVVRWSTAAWLGRHGVATVAAFAERFLAVEHPPPVSIDLKAPGVGEPMIDVIAERAPQALPTVYLAGKRLDELVRLRAHNADIGLVHSSEAKHFDLPLAEHAEILAGHGIQACNVPVEDWSAESVAATQQAGVLVFSSLINQPDRMRTALGYGVDGVHTDDVAAMVQLLDEWDANNPAT